MIDDEPGAITLLLDEIRAGNDGAKEQLAELMYRRLHRLAVDFMRRERKDHTLQPTALLNEALLELLRPGVLHKATDRHFLYRAAATAMRRILTDHARKRAAQKRGGALERVPLDDVVAYFEEQHLDVLALHEALNELAALDPRQGEVVTLRFFGGYSVKQIAQVLGVSVSTVESDWRFARAWLHQRLGGNGP